MLKQQTQDKLKKMNMTPIIDAAASLEGIDRNLTKEEWLEVMVDRLYDERMTIRINNLIKSAKLPVRGAYIEDLITDADRELDLELISKLTTCTYINKGHNVVLLGASGAGKSWLSSALALSACRQLYRVECISMPEMVSELETLRFNAEAHRRRMKELSSKHLLVVDDWLIKETTPEALDELYALVDVRCRAKKSTIFWSQYRVDGWCARMGHYPSAAAVVDGVKNSSYVIELKGSTSMRERCMDEELKAYAKQ